MEKHFSGMVNGYQMTPFVTEFIFWMSKIQRFENQRCLQGG
jgi:hypothetical protein